MVEHLAVNENVAGSSPASRAKSIVISPESFGIPSHKTKSNNHKSTPTEDCPLDPPPSSIYWINRVGAQR